MKAIDALEEPSFFMFPDPMGPRGYDNTPVHGYDLLPKIAKGAADFYQVNKYPLRNLSAEMDYSDTLSVVDCEVRRSNGAGGHLDQYIGPFVSRGGYDFWEASYADAARLSAQLDVLQDVVYLTELDVSVVDDGFRTLPLPPIHRHHANLGYYDQLFSYRKSWWDAHTGESGIQGTLYASGGDTQYCMTTQYSSGLATTDGLSWCTGMFLPNGYGITIDKPLSFWSCFNDVRAPNSPPMSWWLHASFEWKPRSAHLKPLSFITTQNEYHKFNAYTVPTRHPTILWYTGRMPRNGRAVVVGRHAHGAIYNRSFFFAASPDDLGLHKLHEASSTWEPITLHEAGFANFDGFITYMLGNFNESVRSYDRSCAKNAPTACGMARPSMVSQHWGAQELVDGYLYDRYGPNEFADWSFQKGDVFTAVFLNHAMDPRSMGIGSVRNRAHYPETFGQHSVYLVMYSADDSVSHSERLHYSHDPDGGRVGGPGE